MLSENDTGLKPGDALLLVDVQNDFFPGNNLPVDQAEKILPVLNQWIRAAQDRGIPVYLSRDWHPLEHISFKDQGGAWPPHCIQNSEGAGFHPDLDMPDDARGIRFKYI